MSRARKLRAFIDFMIEGVSQVLSHPNLDEQLRDELLTLRESVTEVYDGLSSYADRHEDDLNINDLDRLLWALAAGSFAIGSKCTVPPGAIKYHHQEVQPKAAARAASEKKLQRQAVAAKYRHLPVDKALPSINGDLAKRGMTAINAKTLYRYRSVDK